MVVGYLRGVEDTLRLLQCLTTNGFDELSIGCNTSKLRLVETVECLWTFGVNVIREILCVYTGIGGVFLLVERLNEVEGHLCGEPELAVAVNLQRGKVVKLWRLFFSLFLFYFCHYERLSLDGGEGLFSLLLGGKFPFGCRKCCIAINGGKHPIRLRLEVLNLFLAIDNQGKGWGLYSSDTQHLSVLSVFQGVETGGVHA